MKKARHWLTKLRNKKSLTQQQVADAINIDRSFYCQIESSVRNPSVDTAKKIAEILGFDWTIFFNHNSGEKQQKAI